MIGTISHVFIALLVQVLIACVSGSYWIGALFCTGYYLGREIAQAEMRWLKVVGVPSNPSVLVKLRAIDPRAWDRKGVLDWTMPALVTAIVAVLA